MGVSSPPDMFGSARWELFFRPLCPVGQKRTRGVRLGRPAGDALIPPKIFVATKSPVNFYVAEVDVTARPTTCPFTS
jgi:hypothetical protein